MARQPGGIEEQQMRKVNGFFHFSKKVLVILKIYGAILKCHLPKEEEITGLKILLPSFSRNNKILIFLEIS